MIVASLLLVIAAAVTLLLGLFNREQIQWVWASIACCLVAGLLLTIGVLRSRPSRKPVLQSGGEGAAASWPGASTWGGNAGGGDSSAAVLTRDDDDAAETGVVGDTPAGLQGDDEPTRTNIPAPAPTADEDAAVSPWAPTADEDTGDVRVVSPAAPEVAEPVATAPESTASADDTPAAADDDIIVVPKPSARGGQSAETAVVTATSGNGAGEEPVGGPIRAPKETTSDDAARFEQVLKPIAGVGPAKRAALLQHFGTYRKLRAASPQKLAEVPGISPTLADRIYSALHSK